MAEIKYKSVICPEYDLTDMKGDKEDIVILNENLDQDSILKNASSATLKATSSSGAQM